VPYAQEHISVTDSDKEKSSVNLSVLFSASKILDMLPS